MFFAAGCATSPRPSAAVTAQGNAYRVALPAGTVINFPASSGRLEAARAVAVNETTLDGDRALTLTAELQLVSPAYIAERDAAEVRYARRIIELESKLNPTK